MNLHSLVMTIFQGSSPSKRQENIRKMSTQLMTQFNQINQLQKGKKQSQQKHLFEAFFKVLQNIAYQVQQTKQKYHNLDKQKLKEDKCIQLAQNIKIFRGECHHLKDKLAVAKKQLRNIKIQNQIIAEHRDMMKKACQRKSKQKEDIKSKTMSQFWSKDLTKSSNFNKLRKTAFDNRIGYSQDISLDLSKINRLSSKRIKQQRNFVGKSLQVQINKSGSHNKISRKKIINYRILDKE